MLTSHEKAKIEYFLSMHWNAMHIQRPYNGQCITYYLEPFSSFHVGIYHSEDDSVACRGGFMSTTEVPYWYPMAPIPENFKWIGNISKMENGNAVPF